MEFYKWLNEAGRKEILKIINNIWKENCFLENMEEANVITVYKQGNVEDPASYRLISLPQSIHNIYAGRI